MSKNAVAPTAPAVDWPRVAVEELLSPEVERITADPELVESVTKDGVQEPLYIVTSESGALRIVDGMRRLSAAREAGLTEVPVTYRPVVPVSALTGHPGNVRHDLRVSKQLRQSIRAEGVRVPVKVTRAPEGLRIVDGHRRLAAAVAEGLTHLPYEFEERDEAGQVVDMITTARHREGLTNAEEAAALFAASELGAGVKRLASASGRSQKDVKTLMQVGGSDAVGRVSAVAAYEFTLEELQQLAALEKADPEAARRVEAEVRKNPGGNHRWTLTSESLRVERAQKAAEQRAELEARGARIVPEGELSGNARTLRELRLSENEHAQECQGHVYVLSSHRADSYDPWCANGALYGHFQPGEGNGEAARKERAAQMRAVRAGNLDWDAAAKLRRDFVAKLIRAVPKKAQADAMLRAVTVEMYAGSRGRTLGDQMGKGTTVTILAELFGLPEGAGSVELAKKAAEGDARRLPAVQFAQLAACHESRMRRDAWRTDDQRNEDTRQQAIRYLTRLSEDFGYEPTPIEKSVIEDAAYVSGQEKPEQSQADELD